jgi:predicted phage-related endonuclease
MASQTKLVTDRNEWLEWRQKYVTASSVPAIFNCHPYVSPARYMLEKRGLEFPVKNSKVMERGLTLEPAIAGEVEKLRPGWKLEKANIFVYDDEIKLAGTPDYLIHGDQRGVGNLECKSVTAGVWERDWNDGQEPPRWVILQTLTQAMLLNSAFACIGVMKVDAFDMRVEIFDVPRHAGAERSIIEAVRLFWEGVEAGRDPTFDYSKDGEAIAARVGFGTKGKTFDASGHNMLPPLLAQRSALMARIKDDKARCHEIENEIKLLMDDAEIIQNLPGWRVTFKTTNRAGYVVEPKTIRSLRILDRRPAHERPDADDVEDAA